MHVENIDVQDFTAITNYTNFLWAIQMSVVSISGTVKNISCPMCTGGLIWSVSSTVNLTNFKAYNIYANNSAILSANSSEVYLVNSYF